VFDVGVIGYLFKDVEFDEFFCGVCAAVVGEVFLALKAV